MPENDREQDSLSTLPVKPSGEGSVPAECLVFVAVAGPGDQGKSLELKQGSVVVGRDEDCDLVLEDASVSRQHTRLTSTPEGILVEDLGSTNGTSYLGKRIERATLQVGARMDVGSCAVDLLPVRGSRSLPVSTRNGYGALVGASLPMRRLYTTLEMLEKSDVPVLIEGETGTGKELVAKALHDQGRRAGKAFVTIDCGNVPSNLMESELFGHRKGAFTGAVADRAGAFEAASGGTVFLDELGELPLELQPKLLRVLETGQVKRLGDARHVPVDVRVLAATRRNLALEVQEGRFREDLYYRVAVVHLELPPLRDRRDDIPALVEHLARGIAADETESLPREAVELFTHHAWPGNVRELRNAVHRALTLGIVEVGDDRKNLPCVPAAPGDELDYRKAKSLAVDQFERSYLQHLMSRFEGNVSAAARAAGIDRKTLRDLLKKQGMY